ncbi:Vacuolar morphogenesis protein 6, partial [Dipsacomyces acuminosporus]
MHDAFNIRPVLKQLPVRIESAAVYGDRLLLGTANGALLVYRVLEPTKDRQLAVTLIETKKAFARRAVEQLEVIKEAGVLICLADGIVTLHDLHTLSEATPLNNTKGASVISVHTAVDHIDGIPTLVSKLAVYAKRRVVILEWRDAEFYKSFEYSAADRVTAMQFSSPRLLTLSSAREFLTLQLPEGQWDDLFPADTASLRTLAGGYLSGNGTHSVFVNSAGKLCSKDYSEPMAFSQQPTGVTYTSSYVIAISQEPSVTGSTSDVSATSHSRFNVEVRNIGTQALVQSLYLSEEEPTRVFNGSGGKQVWAIGPHTVWRLMPAPIQQQVEDVLKAGQYEEAMSLVSQSDNILEAEKDELTQKIRWLRARWLFREQGQYEEALSEFSELEATPTEAIALCPERIAGELAEDLDDTETDDSSAEADADTRAATKPKPSKQVVWKEALFALMRYLTEHRRWLQQAISCNKRELEYAVRVLEG